MGVSEDLRKKKIKELKQNLKQAYEEYYTVLEKKPADDAKQKEVMAYRDSVSNYKLVIEALTEELRNTKRNKTGSKFTTFTPSPPNRRTRKRQLKLMRAKTRELAKKMRK